MIESIANWLLYVCLSFVIGYTILQAISQKRRPEIMGDKIYLISIFITPLLLAVPVGRVVWVLSNQFGLSWIESIQTVLFEYSVGQAWFLSIMIVFVLITWKNKKNGWQQVILAALLVGLASWSSHAASIAGWGGFVGNYIHYLAVTVWIGILAVVSWFSVDDKIPSPFFKWYSLTAAFSVSAIILSGFLLMGAIVPEYVQSWLLTYGQLLLIKHLLFLPLLAFGFHHLVLGMKAEITKTGLTKQSFKIESVLAFVILLISGMMTEQTPPHEVVRTLQTESITPMMQLFIGDAVQIGVIHLTVSSIALITLLLSCLLFLYGLYQLLKKQTNYRSVISFVIAIIGIYFSFMMFVEVGDNQVDETVYQTLEQALMQNYEESTELVVLKEMEVENERYVVYTVNGDDLVAERLIKVEDGYQRLPVAMLTIGGTSVREEEQKIRTFRVQSGNWHDDDFVYTYVTFGMIQEPEDVVRVQVHYEGGSYIAQLENEVFLNVTSTNDAWDDQHPIDFLAEDGTVIETYARNVMEEGVYCH
ncbi:copper resistance D family protein [Alkalihalobacillus hemicellulosilyticus]|uniref:Copper resistance protein D domain-containing protein n=1 Tax=Halalkalibacter hemicellulosilyticusJCM 9152 TaxID=1236971 RepID=W4QFL3_9BACI|nr:CopD family protein [Halalkalibacter hemicellulosilyticus]GAE30895.1 hypothetical protein JCM9152_2325 [Halalkalibacter hemicellulosilyticusJCM 9152]